MVSVYDVNANELIGKASEELKKVEGVNPPVWAIFVKTGMHKERPPVNQDWWYIRAAAVLRTIYRLGPIGVSKLRTKYGGKKNRGFKPEHFYKGSGNIARKILQQLEKADFVKQTQKGVHKGRVITAKGKSFLDKIATQIYKGSKPKEVIKLKEEKLKEDRKEVKDEKKAKKEDKRTRKEDVNKEVKKEENKESKKEPEKKETK